MHQIVGLLSTLTKANWYFRRMAEKWQGYSYDLLC